MKPGIYQENLSWWDFQFVFPGVGSVFPEV
jgi:hypothetical protein